MFLFTIAFLMGDLYLQTYSQLPEKLFIDLFVIINFLSWLIMMSFLSKRKVRPNRINYLRMIFYMLFAFILGFVWSAWYAHSVLTWRLAKEWEGKPLLVTGYVASLPMIDEWQTSFLFQLTTLQYGSQVQAGKTTIRLTWRASDKQVKVGDQWQFLVHLKRIHSTQNPNGFDFEAWALQKGLRATGYILTSKENQLLSHHWYRYPINQVRGYLQEKLRHYLPQTHTAPWLMALLIGERTGINPADWNVLRNTGTNHLMAIAGLHIGIMSAIAHTVATKMWKLFPRLLLLFPASQFGACVALFTALGYSALAGFSIPTQRACIMLLIFISLLLLKRQVHAWSVWSLAMLIVLLLNPLDVLTESFWLSFGTIALILYGMSNRLAPSGYWWKWGRVQWVIGIGLIPFSLLFFQECSFISFLANSIAIPWLEFLILPFGFLSVFFIVVYPPLGAGLLAITDKSLACLWWFLAWLAQFSFSSWQHAMPNLFVLLLACGGCLLLLLPAGCPGRWLSFIWILPLILYPFPKPAAGDIWMTLLDVGQGLAVVLETQTHTLVYDTGPKYHTNVDMGENVILPFLKGNNIQKIDMLVISHGDNDHLGGASALLKALPIATIKTSVPEKFSTLASFCLQGMTWQWDQVNFAFIYPAVDQLHLGNDSSCVLRIDNGRQIILLAGDIEKSAEDTLINRSERLKATIFVAPHHGSKTSGLPAFIKAVQPEFVLYAIGYRNRYHFPHPSIVKEYALLHAMQLNTADMGAIQFKLSKNKSTLLAENYRFIHKRYWLDE